MASGFMYERTMSAMHACVRACRQAGAAHRVGALLQKLMLQRHKIDALFYSSLRALACLDQIQAGFAFMLLKVGLPVSTAHPRLMLSSHPGADPPQPGMGHSRHRFPNEAA